MSLSREVDGNLEAMRCRMHGQRSSCYSNYPRKKATTKYESPLRAALFCHVRWE